MTSADPSAALDSAAFNALFDAAQHSVFRLESHQFYGGDPAYDRWRQRQGRPERSVRTSAWLARIARTTAAGVSWSRARIVTEPVSNYTLYEVLTYVESQAAGEQVGIVEQDSWNGHLELPEDFWLIDAGTPDAVAVWMHYADDGALISRVMSTDPATLDRLGYEAVHLRRIATPLNDWLPGSGLCLVG